MNLCEIAVKTKSVRSILLRTRLDADDEKLNVLRWQEWMDGLRLDIDVTQSDLHDRRIDIDNGWEIILGRGLDWYAPTERFGIGTSDPALRLCRRMEIRIKRKLAGKEGSE